MNPQVQNPHLIYPGDVINVFYVGGRPYLTVNGETRVSALNVYHRKCARNYRSHRKNNPDSSH